MGEIYDAALDEYTPIVAQEIITPSRLIVVGLHTTIDGMLHQRQQYTVDVRVCCTLYVSCPLVKTQSPQSEEAHDEAEDEGRTHS
jgi:hypothetical protein